jgi:hypothetical protein
VIIHWQDKDYELDFSDLTIKQAETIEHATGMSIGSWLTTIDDFDSNNPQFLVLLKVLYWLMLAQNGDKTPIGAVDFPIIKFGRAFAEAAAASGAPAAAVEESPGPDPTQPGLTAPPEPSTPMDGTSSPPAPAPATAPG